MKYYLNPAEFNKYGYHLLSILTFISHKLILWAPTSSQLNDTYNNQFTIFKDKNLLDLIEEGHIQIMARERWITDKKFRNDHGFIHAKWNDDFDNKIKEWAIKDQSKDPDFKRVIIAENEIGYEEADKILSSKKSKDKDKVRKAQERLSKKNLPIGILEKCDRLDDNKIRVVLRDLINHRNTFEQSKADVPIELFGLTNSHIDILGVNKTSKVKKNEEISTEKLMEFIEILNSISPPKDMKDFKKVLRVKEKNKKDLLNEIYELSKTSHSISEELYRKITENYRIPSWKQTLTPKWSDKFAVLSLILSLTNSTFNAKNITTLLVGLTTLDYTKRVATKVSLTPADYSKAKYIAPFIWANETDKPTYKNIKELKETLLKFC